MPQYLSGVVASTTRTSLEKQNHTPTVIRFDVEKLLHRPSRKESPVCFWVIQKPFWPNYKFDNVLPP